MAWRLYIVPVIGDGTKGNERRPKYVRDGTVTAPAWRAMDYGFEPWMVVEADLSASDDEVLVAQSDAFALPFDLSANLTAPQVTSVQNKLEAINCPAEWVSTALTWAEVVRIVLGVFLFVERFTAIHGGRIFLGGVTLESTIGSLPVAVRNELTAAAASLGLSTAGITLGSTLRQALKLLADQLMQRPFFQGVRV